jgi:hypothetical protein
MPAMPHTVWKAIQDAKSAHASGDAADVRTAELAPTA